jgi:hypothetical protein
MCARHSIIQDGDMRTAIICLLLFMIVPSPATAETIRSDEFCFSAWFPATPYEMDDDRVTKGGVQVRARNFIATAQGGSLIISALKFEPGLIGPDNLATYFDSSIKSHARKVSGTTSNVTETRFDGMPARTFSTSWQQDGGEWESQHVIAYRDGYTYVFGAIHPAGTQPSKDGKSFMKRLRIDGRCVARTRAR